MFIILIKGHVVLLFYFRMYGDAKKTIRSYRGSRKKFHTVLCGLNDVQKAAIVELGFRSILDLPNMTYSNTRLTQILGAIDPYRETYKMDNGSYLPITMDELEPLMGLKNSGEIIDYKELPSPSKNLVELYSTCQGGEIKLNDLVYEIRKADVADIHFKRRFLLLLLGMIIVPTTSLSNVDKKYQV
jgi:hypothetical protein